MIIFCIIIASIYALVPLNSATIVGSSKISPICNNECTSLTSERNLTSSSLVTAITNIHLYPSECACACYKPTSSRQVFTHVNCNNDWGILNSLYFTLRLVYMCFIDAGNTYSPYQNNSTSNQYDNRHVYQN
eukprot:264236_1